MAFILPKSNHGSTRLYALRLALDQNPGTSQILLHSCLSLPHRMTVWLPSCLSVLCLQALPHSRACIPPASEYTFPSSSGSVSLVSFSLTMATTSFLSSILLPFSFTGLFEHFGLYWEDLGYSWWFHNFIFSEVGCSNCCWKCGTCWLEAPATAFWLTGLKIRQFLPKDVCNILAILCKWLYGILYSYLTTGKHK